MEEAYNSVAVSNVHLLLLRPEHYDQLNTKVVDRLVAQVNCRKEWEEARGRHMIDRKPKDSNDYDARSLPRTRTDRRTVFDMASLENRGSMAMTTTTTYFVFNMRPATRGTTHVLK